MRTQSGRLVLPSNDVGPSLDDIGYHLQRVPRFVGGTTVPWNVAQHSLACEKLAGIEGFSRRLRLLCLLHDAHEAITGDIPSTWKVPEMKAAQEALDVRIRRELGYMPPTDDEMKYVHAVDLDVLLAEAKLFGPPGSYDTISEEVGGWRAGNNALNAVYMVRAFDEASTGELLIGLVLRLFRDGV